jgi:hypothetical protein
MQTASNSDVLVKTGDAPNVFNVSLLPNAQHYKDIADFLGDRFLGMEVAFGSFEIFTSAFSKGFLNRLSLPSLELLEKLGKDYYLVFNPGVSILEMKELHPKHFHSLESWYTNTYFATRTVLPRWEIVSNKLIENSPGMSMLTQRQSLVSNQESYTLSAQASVYITLQSKILKRENPFGGKIICTSDYVAGAREDIVTVQDSGKIKIGCTTVADRRSAGESGLAKALKF